MYRLISSMEKILRRVRCKTAATLLLSGSFVLVLFQFYFLRELLAAEVLLGLIFITLLTIVGIMYAIGLVSEWGAESLAVKMHSDSRPAFRGRNRF